MGFRCSFFWLYCFYYLIAIARTLPQQLPSDDVSSFSFISASSVQDAFETAEDIIERENEYERFALNELGYSTSPALDFPSVLHQLSQSSLRKSRELEKMQEKFEQASKILSRRFDLSPGQSEFELPRFDLRGMLEGDEVEDCTDLFSVRNCRYTDRYRTLDGTCNNLQHPTWGMASSCFQRILYPDYADGISIKRVARSGNPLPLPRRLSLQIHSDSDNPDHELNHLFMVWGQFLDHDISLTPQSRGPNSELLNCCPADESLSPNCDPIMVPGDDPFYSSFSITCLNNVRSAMCATCTLGPREQMNQVTAYIDASHIYGLNKNESRALRNYDGTGTLKYVKLPGAGELPPGSFNPQNDECSSQDQNYDCFQTGDQRANQHPALTSLHVLFLREHNRIARKLKEINPRWNEEKIFQETRRIIGAEMQVITYREYLPLVLGEKYMEEFDLWVSDTDQYTQYDETMEATLANEFSTAAFRFGHSMVSNYFRKSHANAGYGSRLRDTFNYPFRLYQDGQLEEVVAGLVEAPSQSFDRHMVSDVTNHLFQERGRSSGLDLAALNINRGRDHGIPSYLALVDYCGTSAEVTQWKDLDRMIGHQTRTRLQQLYEDVGDIDLFTGGLAEKPQEDDAAVGPTFACIIGQQFRRLKYGDRFYFEHEGEAGSFSPNQLRELKKMTLGRLICDNSRIDSMPENVFMYESLDNPTLSCELLAEVDLDQWKE